PRTPSATRNATSSRTSWRSSTATSTRSHEPGSAPAVQGLRPAARAPRRRPDAAGGADHGAARPQRRRQIDAGVHPGHAGDADLAAGRAARTYSRGMLQRLAVGRALIHRPKLLLADEPFTGLDRSGVELLGQLLEEERAAGALVVVVTHDFDVIAPLADRVVVLHR